MSRVQVATLRQPNGPDVSQPPRSILRFHIRFKIALSQSQMCLSRIYIECWSEHVSVSVSVSVSPVKWLETIWLVWCPEGMAPLDLACFVQRQERRIYFELRLSYVGAASGLKTNWVGSLPVA